VKESFLRRRRVEVECRMAHTNETRLGTEPPTKMLLNILTQ